MKRAKGIIIWTFLIGWGIFWCSYSPYTSHKRVIIEELVTYNGFGVITNFEKGYGYYLGRTLDSQQVVFEDVVCKYGIGDTIIPMKILK